MQHEHQRSGNGLRLGSHPGTFAEHPLAGPISRKDRLGFHRVNCAHHLSFGLPTSPQ